MALVPIRVYLIPRMPFTDEELDILDGPVASDFVSHRHSLCRVKSRWRADSRQTLESVGGTL